MADRADFEEPLRRVFDANLRYFEAMGRVTQEYFKSVFGIMKDVPIRFDGITPGKSSRPESGARAAQPETPPPSAVLVLEAEAGADARGVFMVENRLGRNVSTVVAVSAFTDQSGRTVNPPLRVSPEVVTLEPGGRTLVQVFTTVTEELETGVAYHATVTVPALAERGIPMLLRRLPSKPVPPRGEATTREESPPRRKKKKKAKTKRRPAAEA